MSWAESKWIVDNINSIMATSSKQNEILDAIKIKNDVNLSSLFTDENLLNAIAVDDVLFAKALAAGTLNNLNDIQFSKIAGKFTTDTVLNAVNLDKLRSCEPFWQYVANKPEYVDLIINYATASDKVVNNPIALKYLYQNASALNKLKINDDFITKALTNEVTAIMTIKAMFDVIKNNSKYVDYLLTTNYNFNEFNNATYCTGLFAAILFERCSLNFSVQSICANVEFDKILPKLTNNFWVFNYTLIYRMLYISNISDVLAKNPNFALKILNTNVLLYLILATSNLMIFDKSISALVDFFNSKTAKEIINITWLCRPYSAQLFNRLINSDDRLIKVIYEKFKATSSNNGSYALKNSTSNKITKSAVFIRANTDAFKFTLEASDGSGNLSEAITIKNKLSGGNFKSHAPNAVLIVPSWFSTSISSTTNNVLSVCEIDYNEV